MELQVAKRKIQTPMVGMRMGAEHEDGWSQRICEHIGWKEMFISGNKRTIILFRETCVPELNLDRELQLAAINSPV